MSQPFRVMFVAAFVPLIVVMAIAYPASLYFGPPIGGISRRGAWPERDYVQQLTPEGIEVMANDNTIQVADVLVMGDSFSVGNVWQSVVASKTGLRFKTYNYKDNNNCFLPWIERLASGLEGYAKAGNRLVMIESIEHQFMERIRYPERCAADSLFRVRPIGQGVWHWPTSSVHTQIDIARQFQTLMHMAQVAAQPGKVAGEWVKSAPLKRGDLFSNIQSNRLLYADVDEYRLQWTQADIELAVATLKAVKTRLEAAGFQFAMLIVPDKLHAYEEELLNPLPSHAASDLAQSLRAAGVNAPDVLSVMKKSIYKAKDVYMPNDDHLGPNGHRALAQALVATGVFAGVQSRQP
ncbi:hypothetical protein [Rhodoferax sp.]|uniref:alginate O-acetyltransferase AlgX-related protein n=1 Tax=Rhodoferax sp. TaxID=50421 RepID=UPI00260C174D|nr:hypothetical protein [Rhodoferax sp.]MDD5478692.1 hypothetical protein [Rhodoferax sp.]